MNSYLSWYQNRIDNIKEIGHDNGGWNFFSKIVIEDNKNKIKYYIDEIAPDNYFLGAYDMIYEEESTNSF